MNKQKRNIIILGIATVLLWLLYVPLLFQAYSSTNKEAHNMVKMATKEPQGNEYMKKHPDKTSEDLERSAVTELRSMWMQSALWILLGIVSGVLIIIRNRFGYFFAIVLAALLLINQAIFLIEHSDTIFTHLYTIFSHQPFRLIRDYILKPLILVLIITYLTRPAVKKEFLKEVPEE